MKIKLNQVQKQYERKNKTVYKNKMGIKSKPLQNEFKRKIRLDRQNGEK